MTSRTACILGVVCLVLGVLAAPSSAQPEAEENPKARAQEHYQAGVRAYNVGDFDLAIQEWKTGYRLHGSPDFLFNIAQAYRGKRDYQNALFFFNAYLRERPDAPNAEEVTGLRDEMERLVEEERSSRERPPKEPIAPDQSDLGEERGTGDGPGTENAGENRTDALGAAEEDRAAPGPGPGASDQPRPASGRNLKLAGIATGAGGLALVATGVVFSFAASAAESDLERAAREGEPWTPALEDKNSTAKRNATLGKVFIAAGAAAAIGGAVTYYLGYRLDAEQRAVAVVPSLGSQSGVAVRLRF